MRGSPPTPLGSRLCGRLRPLLAAALGLGAAVLFGLPPEAQEAAREAAPETVRQTRDRVLGDPAYQTRLPLGGGFSETDGREDRDLEEGNSPSGSSRGPRGSEDWNEGWGEGAQEWAADRPTSPPRQPWSLPITPAVAWITFAVVGLLLLLWLLREGRTAGEWLRVRSEESAGDPEPPTEALETTAEGAAEALALRGAYAEAVHRLLLAALGTLQRWGRASPVPGHTSREILGTLPAEDGARRALEELVAVVERSLFGGRPVSAGDWERCRTVYGTLTEALESPQ